jgi:predicted ester cyclase
MPENKRVAADATLSDVEVAETLIGAFNDRQVERAMALVDDSAEWQMVPFGVTNHGPEGYRRHWEIWTTAAPDCRIEIENLLPSNGCVVAEFIARGTHTGPLSTPKGELPPSGARVEFRLCDVIRIRDGKSYGSRIYFDMLTLLRQFGVVPA